MLSGDVYDFDPATVNICQGHGGIPILTILEVFSVEDIMEEA